MAYDKVVDSAVLDAGLKAIADAIREKGGTSDNLAFPTAMADAIKAIEAGGGGGIYETTFIPSVDINGKDNTTFVTLNHNLGVTPRMVFIHKVDPIGTVRYEDIIDFIYRCDSYGYSGHLYHNASTALAGTNFSSTDLALTYKSSPASFAYISGYPVYMENDTSITICGQMSYSNARFKAGVEYRVVVIA